MSFRHLPDGDRWTAFENIVLNRILLANPRTWQAFLKKSYKCNRGSAGNARAVRRRVWLQASRPLFRGRFGGGARELGEPGCRYRGGEEETLEFVAAEGSQERELRGRFDPLGHDVLPERVRHGDHRRHDRLGIGAAPEPFDEHAVDLDGAHGI